MRFDDAALARIRAALLGEGAEDLIALMHAAGTGAPPAPEDPAAPAARALGWLDAAGRPTAAGRAAADSCREYTFWRGRDRQLPFAGAAPALAPARFAGREVLELGCGMGANLMSLADAGARPVGLEPVAAYVQLGAILRAREGRAEPEIRTGAAEAIPFESGRFDTVLCVTAHQYFDIRPALGEIARVLRPGGEAVIIGCTLPVYVAGALGEGWRGARALKAHALTAVNTLGYTALGRRVVPARGGATTSRPIYPSAAAMQRWLAAAGLAPVEAPFRVGDETCHRARRPG